MSSNLVILGMAAMLAVMILSGCGVSEEDVPTLESSKKINLYSFSTNLLGGEAVSLDRFRGKVVLVVNTASKCGFTPQYEGLENLYKKYKDQGLEIIGFPCNQFGNQEPGTAQEIQQFCQLNYGVSFTMFDKIDVNGENAHPLYKWLKKELPGVVGTQNIKWNFTKFLIDRQGNPVKRYGSQTKPEDLAADIEKQL